MLILTRSDIGKLIDPAGLMKEIKEVLILWEDGKTVLPDRMHARFGAVTLLLMPGYAGDHFVTKLVSVNPGNRHHNLPAIYGTVVLNDGSTGKPLALLEGSSLTAHRTAAVSALGIRYTVPENISSVGLVGAGVQGYHQLLYACREKPVKHAFVFDFNPEAVSSFIRKISKALPDVSFTAATSAEALLESAQLIITATTSHNPVLPDRSDLLQGKHFIAVGSYTPAMQELPGSLFGLLDGIVVDTPYAATESGDVLNPVKNGQISREKIIPLSHLITQKNILSNNKTTLFKSVGMALFDLAVAKYLYDVASKANAGTHVDFE